MIDSIKRVLVSYIVRLLPETSCFAFKRFLYRWIGCEIGEDTQICSSARLFVNGKLIIGKNVWIGPEAIVSSSAGSEIIIEDYCKLGMRTIVVTGFHEITPDGNSIEGKGTSSTIVLKKGCAVSTTSIILPGKTVGEMAHVAAGSVVTKDVPSYHRVAGVPAKVIKDLREK
jgi:acetyltransferase-like isoleucine patch superfamily enzyme